MTAELRAVLHLRAGLPEEFRGRCEAYCHADNVAVDLRRFTDKLEFVVEFLDDGSFDDFVAQCFNDGVPEKDRNTKSSDLCTWTQYPPIFGIASTMAAISTPACLSW